MAGFRSLIPDLVCDASKDWWSTWQASRSSRNRFSAARMAEGSYGRQLRRIAAAIDGIVRGFAPTGTEEISASTAQRIVDALQRYSAVVTPWSEAVARRILDDISNRDMNAWIGLSRHMGRGIREEIENAPTGLVMRQALQRQVDLIQSIPIEAAQRVHALTTEALATGRRAADIAKDIMASGEVARGRANLIARTEVGRTVIEFTKARAEAIGSTHFQWFTAGDRDVRPLHKKLEGKVFRWDDPPVIGEKGERGLPGGTYNCRCSASVIVPERFLREVA
jgi:SPP1 gp7 family putative phage head morphogenesis protein